METVEEVLAHFGIKGMHWGVRRNRDTSGGSKPKKTGPSADAARAQKITRKVKARGVHSLSNAELKQLNERINLEQNYARLTADSTNVSRMRKGHSVIKEIIGVGTTAKQTYELVNSPMVKDISKMLAKKGD